jgi:Tfp pilus assembly protein PilW
MRGSNVKRQTSNVPRGITLLELAVSVAIGSVVFMILGAIFIAQGRYFAIEDAIAETQYNGFQALDVTGLFASSAKRVMSSQVVRGTNYSSTSTLVVLELPSIDAAGALVNNSFDYVAIGQDPADASKFMYDLDAATGTARTDGKFVKALLVDTVIFRYNAVVPAGATAIELYVRAAKDARGRTIRTPLGKIYFLGSS